MGVAPARGSAPSPRDLFDCRDDRLRLGHAARPIFAACHLALVGSDEANSVLAERGEISSRRRMLPHPHIHGGRREHRLVGGKDHGRGEIGREPLRHLGEKIGGRGRNDDEVGLARETDMSDLGLVLEVEELGESLLPREHGERKRRDERSTALGQDRAHRSAPLLQAAHEIEALIGGDAAANDQENALAVHVLSLTPATPLVIPAQAGIQRARHGAVALDTGFRRYDARGAT